MIFYKYILIVLTPADETHHIDKHKFTVPFVCGARDLGEALRRIAEGAAMIRTKGQAGTGTTRVMNHSSGNRARNELWPFSLPIQGEG